MNRPTDPATRVWHRERLVLLGLVFVGGVCGTWVRAELSNRFPVAADAWPWTTFWINVSGAFVLGVLLGLLARLGDDSGWRRRVRLGLGTGVLGGYTTYSTFAVEVVERQRDSLLLLSTGYALASLVCGVLAAAIGLRVTAR
ncbi:fluoride efflux transporter FluC [Calidifontibacter indicus]|uniref:fluoride efflux transporter FluC n=1 Tax=Calidifontibacter indicus TaxID=419650 RepID=UPI001FE53111|nr:CrcB family protein [Calidifontibacter indicus]